jgi:hypothetical protein
MKLLVEAKHPLRAKYALLTEERERKRLEEKYGMSFDGFMIVRGPYQKVGGINSNGRTYPRSVWEKNLAEGSSYRHMLRSNAVLGELEHPESGVTHLARVSHRLLDNWLEELDENNPYEVPPGEYVMGEEIVLNTVNGKNLQALYEGGVMVPVSSRGHGNVQEVDDGVQEVCDDYELETFDHVCRPSVVEAVPRLISSGSQYRESLEEQDVGSGSVAPGAAPITPSTPPTEPPPAAAEPPPPPAEAPPEPPSNPNSKAEAEALVRKMKELASSDDVKELVAVITQAASLISTTSDDFELEKQRDQIMTLLDVISRKVLELEGGSEKKKKRKGKKEESVSMLEQTVDDIASDDEKETNKDKTVLKGDLEARLKRHGLDSSEANVAALADALRRKGFKVEPQKYTERRNQMADNAVVEVASAMAKRAVLAEQKLKEFQSRGRSTVSRKRYETALQVGDTLLDRAEKAVKENKVLRKRYEDAIRLCRKLQLELHKGGGTPVVETRTPARVQPTNTRRAVRPPITEDSVTRAGRTVVKTDTQSNDTGDDLLDCVTESVSGK